MCFVTAAQLIKAVRKMWVSPLARVQLQRSKFVTKMTSLNNVPAAGAALCLILQLITFHHHTAAFTLWANKLVASQIHRLLHYTSQTCRPSGYLWQYLVLRIMPWIVANLHQQRCSKTTTSKTNSVYFIYCVNHSHLAAEQCVIHSSQINYKQRMTLLLS